MESSDVTLEGKHGDIAHLIEYLTNRHKTLGYILPSVFVTFLLFGRDTTTEATYEGKCLIWGLMVPGSRGLVFKINMAGRMAVGR